jgi:signal transduction histidine kinase
VTESEIFRSEVHSLFLRPFLDEVAESLGPQRLAEILTGLGTEERRLRDQTAWVSLGFCEAFFEKLGESGMDAALFERCGRLALSAKYLGILRPLFRTFGTPLYGFRQATQSTGRFNKVGEMTLVESRPGLVRLEYRSRPGAPRETGSYICRTRAAQLAAIPTMFDLQPAEVEHFACMHRGDPVCRYQFKWREYGRQRASRYGFAIGSALGVVLGWFLGRHVLGIAVAAIVSGAGAGFVGWMLKMRQLSAGQLRDLADVRDALARSARFNEERFAQLAQAKQEVDRVVADRTAELRDANLKLARTLDELKSLQEAQRNFFANVSHDLRTPLTLILAPLDELLDGVEISLPSRRSLETIQRNAQQLRRLIDQLLDLEKIQSGNVELVRSHADMRMLIENVSERFAVVCAKRGLSLNVSGLATVDPVWVDPRWIDSALTNLVSNATRFARTLIAVRVFNRDDSVVVEVEDDGPGIARSELGRIFERFVQAGTAGEQRGGTGLGLAIAREAARLHGGSLSVGSEPGVRTTFTLALPRSVTADVGAADRYPVSPPDSGPPVLPPLLGITPDRARRVWDGPSTDSPLIVVIEDDDELRVFIAQTLSVKYRVEVEGDGEAGLALIAARHPDAVVCDVAMPKVDGYEVCRRTRAMPEARFLPILLVTARRQVERVLEGFAAGATDYITKPFYPRELLARLESHLLVRRLLKESAHKERLATLGMLAASVAHQVRNPLSAMTNTLVALQRKVGGVDAPTVPGMFALLDECATRIDRFTKDLLDLSRVDHAEADSFSPARGLQSVIRMMSATRVGAVKIAADLDETIRMKGRLGDMNHVFMNLMDNALRAVEPSGRIDLRTYLDGSDFVFEVGDSGPGIPFDKRAWIFEPFATTRSIDGTGLGLFIVKKIVMDHGGEILVDRSPLGGALFRVRIPGASADTATFAGAERSF